MARERKHICIGFSNWATGFHPSGWRLEEARVDGTFSGEMTRYTAQLAERGKFDFYLIGEQVSGHPRYQYEHLNHVLRAEALTLASYAIAVTEKIGVVTTTNLTYSDPYSIARATATLDHLSKGRFAWNTVTGRASAGASEAAANYGREKHWDTDQRFDAATEFVEIVTGLWDGWEDDALVADKKTGQLLNPEKIHTLGFKGKYYSVDGPLNVARPIQGQIPIFHAGQSERSIEFGARFADVRFIDAFQHEEGKRYYADVKSRLAKYGRHPDDLTLAAGISVYVDETASQAHELYRRIQNLSVADYDLTRLSAALGFDASAHHLDTPLDEIEVVSRLSGQAALIVRQARTSWNTDKLTIKQLYLSFRRTGNSTEVVGGPKEVVDFFERQFHDRVTDGFILFPPYLPGTLEKFVDLVIPELQRRGLFRKEYEEDTFRERLGLPYPENRYTRLRRSGAA